MDIVKSNFKTGVVQLRVTDLDDLWYLSHLIDPKDILKGKTTRKIKIGEGENAKTVKKTMTLTIEAETVEFSASSDCLRINGLVQEGPEDVPRGCYHAISLEVGSEFTLTKQNWLSYQQQKLKEASQKQYSYLLCLFDREEALLALTKKYGFEVLLQTKGEVQKKDKEQKLSKDFYQELIKLLQEYDSRYTPQHIILASPAFYKDDLIKKINNDALKKKIVAATCSSVTRSALPEVMKRPELKDVLKDSRTRQEQLLVEELLTEIKKEGKAKYGLQEVQEASNAGAITKLLVTDAFVKSQKEEGDYEVIDAMMKTIDAMQGNIHIISSKHDAGKSLDGLGGIGAILRYKL